MVVMFMRVSLSPGGKKPLLISDTSEKGVVCASHKHNHHMAAASAPPLVAERSRPQLEALEPVQPISQTFPEALVLALSPPAAEGATSHPQQHYIVVDVRSNTEFHKGHIRGSISVPSLDDNPQCVVTAVDAKVTADLEKIRAKGDTGESSAVRPPPPITVVFVSLRSPDLDEEAALSYRDGSALCANGTVSQVTILLGGLFLWLPQYGENDLVTVEFDQAFWKGVLPPPGSPL